jgi:hypothetical protein
VAALKQGYMKAFLQDRLDQEVSVQSEGSPRQRFQCTDLDLMDISNKTGLTDRMQHLVMKF